MSNVWGWGQMEFLQKELEGYRVHHFAPGKQYMFNWPTRAEPSREARNPVSGFDASVPGHLNPEIQPSGTQATTGEMYEEVDVYNG